MKEMDSEILGSELQRARKQRKLTQAEAADALSMPRTSVLAIEKGERKVSARELELFAALYGRQLADFLRERPAAPSFSTLFRSTADKLGEDATEMESTVIEVEDLARDYLELEKINASPVIPKYPPIYPQDLGRIEMSASVTAQRERMRLDLGNGPIKHLRGILENEVGLRIFFVRMSPKYAGLFFFSEEIGGCIAINDGHTPEKQLWSLAHEYAHFLFHRHAFEILPSDNPAATSKTESLAEAFAYNFLVPAAALEQKVHDLRSHAPSLTIAEILTVADYYGVSVQALFLRLETLDLIPAGYWASIKRDTKVRDLQQRLGLGSAREPNARLPIRYVMLAANAFNSGAISEGRLLKFLHVDRVAARTMVRGMSGAEKPKGKISGK